MVKVWLELSAHGTQGRSRGKRDGNSLSLKYRWRPQTRGLASKRTQASYVAKKSMAVVWIRNPMSAVVSVQRVREGVAAASLMARGREREARTAWESSTSNIQRCQPLNSARFPIGDKDIIRGIVDVLESSTVNRRFFHRVSADEPHKSTTDHPAERVGR